MSLDDIWNEPVASPPKPPPTNGDSSPLKRPRQSLFLSDSDSDYERPPKRATPAPPAARPDVDALFEDLDKEEEDGDLTYKPLAPALDLAKLAKEAEEKHARARKMSPSQTQTLVGGSKTGGVGDAGKDEGKGKADDGEKKGRRVLPKLDEERLVGPEGFPLLIKDIKGFQPKGKGHEVHAHSLWTFMLTLTKALFSTQISIGYCRYTSSGHTGCTQRLRSKIQSTVSRNYVTRSVCR